MLKGGTKAVEVKIHFLPIPNEALRDFPKSVHSQQTFAIPTMKLMGLS